MNQQNHKLLLELYMCKKQFVLTVYKAVDLSQGVPSGLPL